MTDREYDPKTMLNDIEHIFTSYEIRKQGDFEDKEEGCLTICGTYVLNRSIGETVYNQSFFIAIVLTKMIPHVYLPNDIKAIKKTGFNHFYEGGRCCMGTNVDILLSWGDEYDTESFFEKIVDSFLINTISYREEKKAVMGELKHGDAGMEQYYCSLFDVSKKEIRKAIVRTHGILFSKKIVYDQMCICNKKAFRECNCDGKDFLEKAIKNKTLSDAFYEDMRSIGWLGAKKFRRR